MKCPFCGELDSKVLDTRSSNEAIRRRRSCEHCKKRFTTYEKVGMIVLMIKKKDGTREEYNRMKLQDGILRATHKRPIPTEEIEKLIDFVESKIYKSEHNEIESNMIGTIIMEELKSLDAVSYVRFASVYREFKDVDTFVHELKNMLDT